MTGVLLSDRYLAPMTDADLDEVVAIEHVAYEFPWSRGNFEDSLRNGYLGVCLRHVTGSLIGYCVLMPVVDEMHLLNLASRRPRSARARAWRCCARPCAFRARKGRRRAARGAAVQSARDPSV